MLNQEDLDRYFTNLVDSSSGIQDEERHLFLLYGNCDTYTKHIKLIIITDTHGGLREEEFASFVYHHPDYDACLFLGDHSVWEIPVILKYIDINKSYGILGNHDTYDYLSVNKIKNINGEVININDTTLLGMQGSYKYKSADFPAFTQKESLDFLINKPKVDILVTHDTKYVPNTNDIAHQGLFGITYYLYKNKVPYHIHGHIHNPYRSTMLNGTQEISAYMYEYLEL
ncbi:metallophosphoesterase family protein [bacterium]|nr:metallophosphoesterase family protein [bacterium]